MWYFWVGFMTAQPWLNLAGLILDFLGLMLLAAEWRLAIAAERREAAIEEQEEMFRPHPHAPRPRGSEVFDDMRERRRFHERQSRARAAWEARSRWFMVALGAIAIGFLLQIAAAIPLAPLAG